MARGDSSTHGNFTFTETSIPGVVVVDAARFGDARGYFMETYKRPDFEAAGITCEFVQDNQSSSSRGVLRGLHFQVRHPQAKLVRVIAGEVFDVCVDLRPGSPTRGQWAGAVLSAANRRQLFIPRGFAHGFLVLSDAAGFCYKCDDVYRPGDEAGYMWDDPAFGIEWPAFTPEGTFDASRLILSGKDRAHPPFPEPAGVCRARIRQVKDRQGNCLAGYEASISVVRFSVNDGGGAASRRFRETRIGCIRRREHTTPLRT